MTLDEKIRESNQGSHVGVEGKGRSSGTRAGLEEVEVEEEEEEENEILVVVVGGGENDQQELNTELGSEREEEE